MVSHTIMRRISFGLLMVFVACVLATACEGPFSAERHYISTMFGHTRRTLNALNELQKLSTDPHMGDDDWVEEVDVQMHMLRQLIDEAQSITPPARFADVHERYLEALDTVDSMMTVYEQAIAIRNNQELQRAIDILKQARRSINGVRERIETLRNDSNSQ